MSAASHQAAKTAMLIAAMVKVMAALAEAARVAMALAVVEVMAALE